MSLAEKLDQIRAGAAKNIPAPSLELMHRATAELEASGQLDRVIPAGAPLPGYAALLLSFPVASGTLMAMTWEALRPAAEREGEPAAPA